MPSRAIARRPKLSHGCQTAGIFHAGAGELRGHPTRARKAAAVEDAKRTRYGLARGPAAPTAVGLAYAEPGLAVRAREAPRATCSVSASHRNQWNHRNRKASGTVQARDGQRLGREPGGRRLSHRTDQRPRGQFAIWDICVRVVGHQARRIASILATPVDAGRCRSRTNEPAAPTVIRIVLEVLTRVAEEA